VRHAQIAKDDFTDRDIIDFLVNVECLEGQVRLCTGVR
jgi:hypothetical protein